MTFKEFYFSLIFLLNLKCGLTLEVVLKLRNETLKKNGMHTFRWVGVNRGRPSGLCIEK